MRTPVQTGYERLEAALAQGVDEVCDRFEEAWRAEQAARAAIEELERQAEADQLVTRITTELEPIIDEARLIELSSPPKTPMQPEAIDLDKLTRPGAPATICGRCCRTASRTLSL